MKNQMISSVTTYLANLTTKLSNYVKSQNTLSLQQVLHPNPKDYPQHTPKSSTPYKKPNSWTYLQYFTYMFNLNTSHDIMLEKSKQQFTLKQDLHILVAVSSNPQQIAIKSLEQLIKDRKIYKSNYKNVLIKRTLQVVKKRHQFLSTHIHQPELKYITEWIQVNGLQTRAYLRVSSLEKFKKTASSVFVSLEPSQLSKDQQQFTKDNNKSMNKLPKGKRNHRLITQQQQSQQQSDQQPTGINSHFLTNKLVDKKSGSKKVHRQQSANNNRLICDPNIIFGTPAVKIFSQSNIPKAPKKIKQQQDSINQQQLNKKQQLEVLQTPKKKRKFVHIIDVKKDIHIKEDSQSQQNSQTPTKNSPIAVSQFKLSQSMKPPENNLKNTPSIQQNTKQQQTLLELKNIVQEFKTNQKMSEMRILKILSDVSGDMTDLKTYLKTQDRTLLWKRLQDAVLRKYVKNAREISPCSGNKKLTVDALYEDLLKSKGQERVKRRIRYLELAENGNNK